MDNSNKINLVDWNKNKVQKYVTLLIVGYFGVKIFYGLFNKYSKKPMRDEMIDFSTMIVMGSLLYILTNIDQRSILGNLNKINWLFFIGYFFGLNIPFLYQMAMGDENITSNIGIQYLFYAVSIFIVLAMLFIGVRSSGDNPLYYILYLIVIIFMIMGIVMTRQKPRIYEATKLNTDMQNILDQLSRYFDTDRLIKLIDQSDFRDAIKEASKNNPTQLVNLVKSNLPEYDTLTENQKMDVINLFVSLNKPIMQHGYLNVRGTRITFGLAMIGWLLSLLFQYDAGDNVLQNFLSVFNGITIGLFVSGVSFYGFEYLLSDQGEKKCFGDDDCRRKDMVLKNKEYKDLASSVSTMKWGLSFVIMILIIIIILFYTLRF